MNCDQLAESIRKAPMAGWACRTDGEFLRVETPFRYPDGGTVELYIENVGPGLIVSDFGEAFRFLESTGIDPLRSPGRERMIDLAAKLGKAQISQGVIEIIVSEPDALLATLVRLGQVVTRVSDLALHMRGIFANTFSDDLEDYLRENTRGVELRRRATVRGASDEHEFDFVAKSGNKGTSVIEALSAITASGANSQLAFAVTKFVDVAALARAAPRRFAVIDDTADVWTRPIREQLARVADVIDWQRRDVLAASL